MPDRPRASLFLAITLALVAAACATPSGSPSAPATGAPSPATSAAMATATTEPTPTAETAAGLRLAVVTDGFDSPLDIAVPEDGTGRIFVAEQGGLVRTVVAGTVSPQPFLDVTALTDAGGERGLLGLALHPRFPDDPRVFVDYTDLEGNTVVASYAMSLDADVVDPESARILLTIEQPYANHNGGSLAFGPDGKLYIAMGDGGSGGDPHGNGQRLDTLLGKILRIDVDVPADADPAYAIPPDNPHADAADGARPEIWLSGLRNPWRIRFDSANGDLWIGDVGQGNWEEVDVIRSGAGGGGNLGWNKMEGSHCFQPVNDCDRSGLVLPVAEYDHGQGCVVVGGVVVHDPREPALDGRYLFADECSGRIWTLDPTSDDPVGPMTLVLESGRSIAAISEAPDGTVYLADLRGGELLRATTQPE